MKRIILSAVFLAGCTTITAEQKPVHNILKTEFKLKIEPYSDKFITPTPRGRVIEGESEINFADSTCVIRLRNYPQCLLHEIRHCIEGNWHEGIETHDDC